MAPLPSPSRRAAWIFELAWTGDLGDVLAALPRRTLGASNPQALWSSVEGVPAVLAEALDPDAVLRTAWHLRRGYDATYVAPGPDVEGPDRVLRQRGNRLVSASRDGATAIVWHALAPAGRFEVDQWPTRLGVMGMNVPVPGTGAGAQFVGVMGVALALGLGVTSVARGYARARGDELVEAERINDELTRLRRLK